MPRHTIFSSSGLIHSRLRRGVKEFKTEPGERRERMRYL